MARPQSNNLSAYRAKRNFATSPEPKPKVAAKRPRRPRMFCVQKHLASHLHYDFRLEHNGVLLSWAVPKGPSLNPADKRMAMRTEDHPLDYGNFEGVIPSGYGAGIVLLWDKGTWRCEQDDVDAALRKGELKFTLDGVKLKGSWVLVRTRSDDSGREQWLLIKHRDHWSGDVDVTALAPQSVKSFGDLPDLLRDTPQLEEWERTPLVKSGETGSLLRDIIRQARLPKGTSAAARAKRSGTGAGKTAGARRSRPTGRRRTASTSSSR